MISPMVFRGSLLSSSRVLHSCITRNVKTMRAWQAFEYGGPEKLHLNPLFEIPILTKCDDVLVKVHAASINPLDIRMLEGYGSATFNIIRQVNNCSFAAKDFPLILGRDFSGTVIHTGKSVKSLTIGDEVWGVLNPWQNGSHAEYVLASVCHIAKKPTSISHSESASIPYAALTAWAALSTFGELSEKNAYRKKVLIIGATGGVGTFATQLLKTWGAEVTVVCAADSAEKMFELGADNVLDYSSPEFHENLRTCHGFDLIFDNVGGEYPDLTINLLKTWNNSKYITVVSPLLKNTDERGIVFGTVFSALQASFDTAMSVKDGRSFRWAYFIPNGCALKKIALMVDKKQIKPVIDQVFKFDEVPEAFEKCLRGHARGKTVIDYSLSNTTKDDTEENV